METKAFTLVEIIVAMLILGLIVGGMFAVFVGGKKIVIRAGHKTEAINLARQRMEELKSRAYASVDESPAPNPESISFSSGISAERRWTVDDTIFGGQAKQVTVTVTWTEAGSTKQREEEIVTLIANPG
jgi:prepilin-type N-terminal cleavage/methylation domain-containing protein